MSDRIPPPRQRLLALGGLAVGAVLALVAGSRAWWRASGTGVSVSFTGTDSSAGLAQALALVVLAGALLGLVLRSRGRRVLGVLLVLAGAGVIVLGAVRPRPASSTVQSRVLEVSLADQFALVGTAWPYVYAVAGALVVGAAALMGVTAARWPSRAGRFDRPGPSPLPPAPSSGPLGEDDPAAIWRSLDAGVDPTLETGPQGDEHHTVQPPDDAGVNDPASVDQSDGVDVHEPASGVTMRSRAAARTDEPT